MSETVEELAYEQALRAIDHQEATLDGLRSRAGVLLATASLATSFFGGKTLEANQNDWSTAIAVVFFVAVLVSVAYVLWPRRWTFVLSGRTILENQAAAPAQLPAAFAFLATTIENHHDANQVKLNTLMRAFRYGSIALAIEVIAWFLPF